jgi:hypothetical protein
MVEIKNQDFRGDLKITAKDAKGAKKRMGQKSFISSFIGKYNGNS